jgi:adenylate cyclase
MPSRKTLTAIAMVGVIIFAASVAATPGLQFFRGLSLDVATALKWRLFGNRHKNSESPTVVVAFDEETYRTPPFKGTPTVTWTGEMARVLTAVLDGGARVIGFDVIFPTTIEESEIAFGDETVGARMRGFDRDFLRSLAAGASAGKIVLGEVQLRDNLILPAAGQRAAVGQQRNIRSLSVYSDPDEVVRRVPLMLSANGRAVPSMPLELASRALGAEAQNTAAGVDLGGYAIPSFVPNTMTLNFDGGSNDIPTYSLADLRACAAKDGADFFRRNFAGKVVLLGSMLDLEDLKMTSKRFASPSPPQATERCASDAVSAPAQARRSIDGVFVQATAINNLLRREAIVELSDWARWLFALAAAAIETLAALTLSPIAVAFSFLLLCIATAAATAIAFHNLIALPVVEVALAGFAAIVATTVFRLFVTDKDKRLLRRNFEFYLAPAVIEKMTSSNSPPALGGEQRDVSILFSDLVRFSTLSETMSPPDLVALMNRYLSEMTDIIEANGGLIDKYIGDAIVAVFGAPLDDRHHAESAVRAALACCERLASLNAEDTANVPALAHRIGVNSGPAIVGNIGSKRRFNYTAIGDSVNLASRLEGANRYFGTSIIASERTFALAGASFAWRELDVVRVKGRVEAVRIYEPLAPAGRETAAQIARAEGYRKGLALWRARDFAGAASAFARIAETDKPGAIFMKRAMALELEPPAADWEPITALG